MVTVDMSTFDPLVERNSFVVVVVAVSQKQSSTFATESVVSAQRANIRPERPQFASLQYLPQPQQQQRRLTADSHEHEWFPRGFTFPCCSGSTRGGSCRDETKR